jgi:hypothetical protein
MDKDRSTSHGMPSGDAMHVDWEVGPSQERTDEIVRQYTAADLVFTMRRITPVSVPYDSVEMSKRKKRVIENRGMSKVSSDNIYS